MKRALITGVCGQDGRYLTEFLLAKQYRVFGLARRAPIEGSVLGQNFCLLYGDMRDDLSIRTAISKSWPDEIYNLAGQTFVPTSWEAPAETVDVNTSGLLRILKIVAEVKPDTRVYQASSSEMFGNHEGSCSDETPMWPTSPYGVSKFAAHRLCDLYRQRGLYVVSGILFNHESPRRGHEMVTRKIATQVAAWATGKTGILKLGRLDSRRDWGYSKEYVEAMWMMLQQDFAMDYVCGTGESHSVSEFLYEAAAVAGVEKDYVSDNLEIDDRLTRRNEIYNMSANNDKIRKVLNWEPKVRFKELVSLMVDAELYSAGMLELRGPDGELKVMVMR